MKIEWSKEKNQHLLLTRGISFEIVEELIFDGSVIPELHPNQKKYPGQIVLLFRYKDYWWVCPAVEMKEGFFLKTIFPSRKVKKEMDNE